MARLSALLLVLIALAGTGCVADVPNDRVISGLAGPVASVEASELRLPLGSPQPPAGSGQPDLPTGNGKIRYTGTERLMDFRNQNPGVKGQSRLKRRQVISAAGRVELEETTNVEPDGTTVHWRRQSLARDANGRTVEDAELWEGMEYRVSNLYFLPDKQGNPRRVVRLYRSANAAQDTPVLRAEVILKTFRYQDETR
ncbi:MAG: hypothetical protein QM599_03280 [Pseudoxanthomonas sp.]